MTGISKDTNVTLVCVLLCPNCIKAVWDRICTRLYMKSIAIYYLCNCITCTPYSHLYQLSLRALNEEVCLLRCVNAEHWKTITCNTHMEHCNHHTKLLPAPSSIPVCSQITMLISSSFACFRTKKSIWSFSLSNFSNSLLLFIAENYSMTNILLFFFFLIRFL